MTAFTLVLILFTSVVSALALIAYSKLSRLGEEVESLQEDQSKAQRLSPVEGIHKEAWEFLSKKMLDDSTDLILLFDKNQKLKLWNRKAQTYSDLSIDQEASDLKEMFEADSRLKLENALNVLTVPGSESFVDLKLKIKKEDAKDFILERSLNDEYAISLKSRPKVDSDVKFSMNKALFRGIELPIDELNVSNKQLSKIVSDENSPLNREELNLISSSQGVNITTVKNVVQFTKSFGKNKNSFSEDRVQSQNVNIILKSLSLLIGALTDKNSVVFRPTYEKAIVSVLTQPKNLQSLIYSFFDKVQSSFDKTGVNIEVDLKTKSEPMEVYFEFEIRVLLLGREIGNQWYEKLKNDGEALTRYSEQFMELSSNFEVRELDANCVLVSVICPRDIT
ncbi:MAG: hypothetical protein AB8E15_09445 [Bdellovibrionales bacterium]